MIQAIGVPIGLVGRKSNPMSLSAEAELSVAGQVQALPSKKTREPTKKATPE